jgi:hypothetical protein
MVNAKVSRRFLKRQKQEVKKTPIEEIIKSAYRDPSLIGRIVDKVVGMETPYFVITLCLICFTVLYVVTVAPEVINTKAVGITGTGWFVYTMYQLLRGRKIRRYHN